MAGSDKRRGVPSPEGPPLLIESGELQARLGSGNRLGENPSDLSGGLGLLLLEVLPRGDLGLGLEQGAHGVFQLLSLHSEIREDPPNELLGVRLELLGGIHLEEFILPLAERILIIQDDVLLDGVLVRADDLHELGLRTLGGLDRVGDLNRGDRGLEGVVVDPTLVATVITQLSLDDLEIGGGPLQSGLELGPVRSPLREGGIDTELHGVLIPLGPGDCGVGHLSGEGGALSRGLLLGESPESVEGGGLEGGGGVFHLRFSLRVSGDHRKPGFGPSESGSCASRHHLGGAPIGAVNGRADCSSFRRDFSILSLELQEWIPAIEFILSRMIPLVKSRSPKQILIFAELYSTLRTFI